MENKKVEEQFFYTRNTRIAAVATMVAYFSFAALQMSMIPYSQGLLTLKFGDLVISFPAATLVSLLVGGCLYLSLGEFLSAYFKVVNEKKFSKRLRLSPRLIAVGIVVVATWITFYAAKGAIDWQNEGIINLPIGNFNLNMPVAFPLSFVLGACVFLISSYFYRAIEGITPKRAGKIVSEMLLMKDVAK